ncbi:MAG TPA: hypothetical protein DDW17_06940, partial [Deltaproteobacteria bacterium]|nr:hypothetical protein [Deltaproteobacteria bacterium]
YLTGLDPQDSHLQELIEPKVIMERLNISRDTFYVAIAKLKDLGLYDFKALQNRVRTSPQRATRRQQSELSDYN